MISRELRQVRADTWYCEPLLQQQQQPPRQSWTSWGAGPLHRSIPDCDCRTPEPVVTAAAADADADVDSEQVAEDGANIANDSAHMVPFRKNNTTDDMMLAG
jgi:hypothetical protein